MHQINLLIPFSPLKACLIVLVALTSAFSGCVGSDPDLEIEFMTFLGAPVMFEIRNHGREPVTVERIVINSDVEVTKTTNGPLPITIEQGESVALGNFRARAVELSVFTDRGSVVWEIE